MLALISGCGGLPAQVVAAQAIKPLVCVLKGYEPEDLEADIVFRLEHLGTLLTTLKEKQVSEVCFCGAIERPPFNPTALDRATLPLVPTVMRAMGSGDDAALRAVIDLFEQRGFIVRAAHDLAPDLLAPAGVLTRAKPDKRMKADAERGDTVLSALGTVDVGQGCVVGAGQIWAVETIGGTDHMLATLPVKAKDAGAILIKSPKPGQDLRADLPAVGPDTIDALNGAGLRGLVLRAGQVLMLDRACIIEKANAAGLVIWVREPV